MEIIGGLLAGAFIGAVLGFIGAGGAMLSVPILLYIFDFTPQAATTAAIAVVLSAAISVLLPKIKSKEVLFKEASIIWALGLVTNIGFSIVAHRLSDSVITTGFSFVLLTAGTKGKRSVLPNSKVMIHQPMGGTQGQASDIEIEAREILRTKTTLNEIIGKHSGHTAAEIALDSDRNYWLDAQEALKYGLVDRLLERKPKTS